MTTTDHQSPTSPSPNAVGCATGACPLTRHRGLLLWVLVIGFIAYVQWPMLKGMYYRSSGVEAPASKIAWRTDFDAALAEAGRTGKPVLIDFSASWCPPCQTMKHEVWPDDAVAAAVNAGYVPVLADVDDPNLGQIANRYGVQSIPTILVLDAKGEVLRTAAFMSTSEMLTFLKHGT